MTVEIYFWQVLRLVTGIAIMVFTARYDMRGKMAQSGALAVFAGIALVAASLVGLITLDDKVFTVQWLPRLAMVVLGAGWCKLVWLRRDEK